MSTTINLPQTAPRYRRKIYIDHSRVSNIDQHDFPILVQLTDVHLRSTAFQGHISSPSGMDIFFATIDESTQLAHELCLYDATLGRVEAWVKIPHLTHHKALVFYMYYGGTPLVSSTGVWNDEYSVVELGRTPASVTTVDRSDAMEIEDELTVEAWVYATGSGAETIQPLISKWAVSESFGTFSAYDAGTTDNLTCVGFYGAVFDGRYVYWCPIRSQRDRTTVHAHVLRYDTQADFYDPQSWEAYDADNTDALHTVCYYGAAFDGRYVIFTPRDDSQTYHSRVLRYDTHKDFKDSASWEAYDAQLAHSHQGVAFDCRYLYFCPGYAAQDESPLNESILSGKVLRLDTQVPFKDPTAYQIFDTKTLGTEALCFDGGAFDGRYIYFVPLTTGIVVQYDTRNDFSNATSWRTYDAKALGMQMNVGAVFDGRYLYFCAYNNSHMIRYDTQADFCTASAWECFAAGNISGLDTGGFDGGFFDGRFVCFVPWTRTVSPEENKSVYHCNFLRYDTHKPFAASQSWDAYDASTVDTLKSIGYNAGAFDGRFFYGAPLYDGSGDAFHGKVLRYDTTGDLASFSLRYGDYGHNGGLCAAVPGPSFLVNTTTGVASIAAHQVLNPGWHYLAGVYNGRSLKLFVDGRLVAERAATGKVQHNATPISIGTLANGTTQFQGHIEGVRAARIARSDDWLKTVYANLAAPTNFVHLGQEEVL